MTTITIPRRITRGRDLVILPREDYERLLGLPKKRKATIKPKEIIPEDQKWFWTKEWQKKEREADKDIKKGRVYGPFTNVKDLIKSLKSKD